MNIKTTYIYYKKVWFKVLGLMLVVLGIIGIVLPVMPTTIFFILALACFTRSSPALEHWLLNHPRYGTTLHQWQAHKVVPVKAKYCAALGMLVGFIFLLASSPAIWVIFLVAIIEVAVMIYLILRPSSVPKS